MVSKVYPLKRYPARSIYEISVLTFSFQGHGLFNWNSFKSKELLRLAKVTKCFSFFKDLKLDLFCVINVNQNVRIS